ncbi:hypothetical protein [Chitinivibrio alkaliphilus]|uniref:Uncharacterized protein n=1 Tax=Chitinivibrio alkaliphilus ACht1 TaxID=1313304 RepID=U7D6M0_9BACT|nr:hypothetical protein [Chitinivibrio alkaliphilus]ERP32164.1 hypothetical protein CALK_0893 [Chitinivibrio alkaliphilus ACht1]
MNCTKGFTTVLVWVALLCFSVTTQAHASQGSHEARLDSLMEQVDAIMAKAGIGFGGAFQSRGFISKVESDSPEMVRPNAKHREDIMSTTLDLSMTARPLDALGARAEFRLHNDWRNMHTSSTTPVHTRWLSIDGHFNYRVLYNVGDFKTRISPFTIWAPEPTIMYEPEIFAQSRRNTMGEEFLGDNNRVLQGLNVRVPIEIDPVFDLFDFTVLGARLSSTSKDDPFAPSVMDPVMMDRYLFTSNLDLVIREGLGLGMTYMYNGDALDTYGDTSRTRFSEHSNNVLAVRGMFGSDLFSDMNETFSFLLDGEFALSDFEESPKRFTSDEGVVDDDDTEGRDFSGYALRLGAEAGLHTDAGQVILNGAFISNEHTFTNELAQSPVFWRTNVINTEALPSDHGPLNYNAFNALYRHVFHFAPSGDNAERLDYLKRPMNKIAWTRAIMGTDEPEALMGSRGFYTLEEYQKGEHLGMIDRELSPILPFGLATPNRLGATLDLTGDVLDKAVQFSGTAQFYEEMERTTVVDPTDASMLLDKTSYAQFGGGASVDIARLGQWYERPILLSGSHLFSSVEGQLGLIDENNDAQIQDYTQDINFTNLGLDFQFHDRMALLGGVQLLHSTHDVTEVDHDLTQWSTGMRFTVREGASITTSYGVIDQKYTIGGEERSAESKQFDLLMTMKF